MKQLARSVFLSLAGIMSGAGAVNADVMVACDISAKVGLIGIEERASGAPFGAEGLRLLETTRVITTLVDGPAGPPEYEAPPSPRFVSEGDAWTLESETLVHLSVIGSLASTRQAMLELTFLNLTEGASVYGIDLEIEWEMSYRMMRPDAMTDTALLFAMGAGMQHVGADVKTFDGLVVMSDGAIGDTTVRHRSILHLDIGRAQGFPGADTGTIQLALTTQGYVSSLVPSAGAGVMLGVGACMLGMRRRRC